MADSEFDIGAQSRIALAYLDQSRLDEADATFRMIARKFPRLLHGWRGLGLVANRKGEPAEALLYFTAAWAVEPESALALHDLAQALREAGRLAEAERLFRACVAKEPRLSYGWRGLALIAKARGDEPGVVANFGAAIALDPDQAWPHQELATALLDFGKIEQAEIALRDLITRNPRSMQGWRGLGLVARRRGDLNEAVDYFRASWAVDPDNAWPATECAGALREAGRLDEAEAIATALVANAPRSLHGHRELGLIARQRGDRRGELAHFQAAAQADPNSLLALHDLASSLSTVGRLDEAEATFRRTVTKDPRFMHGWRGLALVAKQRGNLAEALQHFQIAEHIDGDNVWLRQEMAGTLRELGRAAEAEALLKSFLDRHPDSADALIAYANALRRRARPADVVALLEQAAATEPSHVHAKLVLADEYMKVWRTDEALDLYDAVLSRQPANAHALMGKAEIARRTGRRADAQRFFAMAAASSEWATIEWSRELAEGGQFDAARDVLATALARNPYQAHFHLRLGYNARLRGDHATARTAFQTAADLNPTLDAAEVEAAAEDFVFGQANRAVERLIATIETHPESTLALETLAHFAEQMDDLGSAMALLRRSLEVSVASLWTRLRLAMALAKLGRIAEAKEVIAKAEIDFGALPETAIVSARILKDQGFYEAGRALLTRAAAQFPTHFELWLQRTLSLIACGAFAEARDALDNQPACSVLEESRVHLLAGELAAAQWRVDEAYAHYVKGISLNAADSWLADCAARAALLRVDVDAARRHLNESARHNASHRTLNQGASKPSQTHIGQLLDEYRLDVVALERLRNCLSQADPSRAIAELVLQAPDYTPAAIALFVSLRQRPIPPSLESAKSDGQSPIPRQIAQFWDHNIPDDIAELCDGWRRAHPDYAYRLFSQEDAQRFLAEKGMSTALAAFNRAKEPAMKADLIRLAYLFAEGGYYIDADDRCIASLATLNHGGCQLILYQEDFGTLGNNFIAAKPRHPAIGLALAGAVESINRQDSDMIWLSTGPGLLTRSIARYLAQSLGDRLNETLILERHELFRAIAIHTRAGYKETRKHWSHNAFRRLAPQRALALAALNENPAKETS